MDLFAPTTYTSIGRNKYGFVIVDDLTRYTWVFFLIDKSDVFATFKTFIKRIHNVNHHWPANIHFDPCRPAIGLGIYKVRNKHSLSHSLSLMGSQPH